MKNFVIITDKLLLGNNAAFYCLIPPFPTVTLISKDHREDGPLLAHELWHYEQYKKRPFTYAFKMLFSKVFRFESEVECYARQVIKSQPITLQHKTYIMNRYAKFIATRYWLDVSQAKAHNALKERLRKPFEIASHKKFMFKNILALLILFLGLIFL